MSGLREMPLRATLLAALLPLCAQADQRVLADGSQYEVSFDKESSELVLSREAASGKFTQQRFMPDMQVLDGACLAVEGGELQLYAFSDRGYLVQWLLPAAGGELQRVRSLPGVVEAVDCYVDDKAGLLYVLEEGVGLWRFHAGEGSLARELLARYAPAGELDPEVEEFSVAGDALRVGEVIVASLAKVLAEQLPSVTATVQTTPVPTRGDTADDPAIWVNEAAPEDSLVLGTDKRYGLRIYDLQGEERAHIATGRLNNVDLRALREHPEYAALAAASNRTQQSISLFGIRAGGEVVWLRDSDIATGLDDPYGLCMYDDGSNLQVLVNDKDGRFQQWRLHAAGKGFAGELLREQTLHDQPEGCVVDDASHRLFYGIEDHGVSVMSAHPDDATPAQRIAGVDGNPLHADVEGMDLYLQGEAGYLVVSSQGDDSYALFERQPPYRYRGRFRVATDSARGIDGTSETDGLAVTATALGDDFPMGMLVVQDGYNVLPEQNQNFKYIDWRSVLKALDLP